MDSMLVWASTLILSAAGEFSPMNASGVLLSERFRADGDRMMCKFLALWAIFLVAPAFPAWATSIMTAGSTLSQAKVTYNGLGTRTISNRWSDTLNLGDFLANNGSIADAIRLDRVVSTYCGRVIHVPAAIKFPRNADGSPHYPTSTCPAGQHANWVYDGLPILPSGGTDLFNTVDDLHEARNNGILLLQKHKVNDTSQSPTVYMQLENSAKVGNTGSMWGLLPMLKMHLQEDNGAQASLEGIDIDVQDYNNTPNASQTQPLSVSVMKHGTGSDWGMSIAGYDYSAQGPNTYLAYTGIEDDLQVNGDDIPSALYDPQDGGRKLLWLGGNTNNQWGNWQSAHKYAAGTIIAASDGLWAATTDCTSASTANAPTDGWSKTSANTDGTCSWTWKYGYSGVISRAIWIDNSNYGGNSPSSFDEGISTNARFRNAFIDLSRENLIEPGAAALRIKKGDPVDLSGNATQSGKNLHTLTVQDRTIVGALNVGTGLNVGIKGVVSASFADDGSFNTTGIVHLAVGGQASMSDATDVSQVGLTVGTSKYSTNDTLLASGVGGMAIAAPASDGTLPSIPNITVLPNHTRFNTPLQLQEVSSFAGLAQDNGYLVNRGDQANPYIFESGTWLPLIVGDASENVTVGGYVTGNKGVLLPNLTKAAILAMTNVKAGMMVFDIDDHIPVINTGSGWYPIQLGTALSN